jgi:hypothetical protein
MEGVMEGLQVQWGDVIRAAAQNPLGIVALIVLGLMVVAVIFFRTASVGVKGAVFAALIAGGGTLVGVMLHEKGDLQQNVDAANSLVKMATSVQTLAQAPDADAPSRSGMVVTEAASLATAVSSVPALQTPPKAAAAQDKLISRRTRLLASRDPATGELPASAQTLDPDTRDAALDLSRSVIEQLQGKSAFEVRELLRVKPHG